MKSSKLKNVSIIILYMMSPFFPGNNWLEVSIIGSLVGYINLLSPMETDLGLLRFLIYLIYNIIAIIGLWCLSKEKYGSSIRDWIELIICLLALILTGFVLEPWLTFILTALGFYLLLRYFRKRIIYHNVKSANFS